MLVELFGKSSRIEWCGLSVSIIVLSKDDPIKPSENSSCVSLRGFLDFLWTFIELNLDRGISRESSVQWSLIKNFDGCLVRRGCFPPLDTVFSNKILLSGDITLSFAIFVMLLMLFSLIDSFRNFPEFKNLSGSS